MTNNISVRSIFVLLILVFIGHVSAGHWTTNGSTAPIWQNTSMVNVSNDFCSNTTQLSPYPNDVVAYFTFDNCLGDWNRTSANDASWSGNTTPNWTSGISGNALSFDGVNDYVEAGNASNLNITGNQITVSVWVLAGMQPTALTRIVAKRSSTSGFYIETSTAGTSKVYFTLKTNSTSRTANSNVNISITGWVHVVGIYNGTRVIMYIDGVEQTAGTNVAGENINGTSNPLRIGTTYTASYFNGSIDEVRIYNRALSSAEVALIRNISKYSTGYIKTWYNSTPNETSSVDVNGTWNSNSNTSIQYSSNSSTPSSFETPANITANQSWSLSPRFNNTDVFVWLFGNGTSTGKISGITLSDETVSGNFYGGPPETPINLAYTQSNFWINYTWQPGVGGNVTNSYNVTVNGTSNNGSITNFSNGSVSPHGWRNISVYAYNNSGTGNLSASSYNYNAQVSNNVPAQVDIGNKAVIVGNWLNFTVTSTDADTDAITYGTNATKGSFNAATGNFNWSPVSGDPGIYYLSFNSSDSYGGVDTENITVTVSAIPTINGFRFGVWGDSRGQTANTFPTLVTQSRLMKNSSSNFTMFVGDLCDADNCLTNWTNATNGDVNGVTNNGVANTTLVMRGNHETAFTEAVWQNYFNVSQTGSNASVANYTELALDETYSFDYGNSHFVAIDMIGGDSIDLTTTQLNWLDSDLTNATNRGLTHAFIFFHGPIVTQTSTHNVTPYEPLISVLNNHSIVSATFHGHEHLVTYTHVNSTWIANLTQPFEQFIVGTSGAGRYNPDQGKYDYWLQVGGNSQDGIATVDVNGSNFNVTIYWSSNGSVATMLNFTKTIAAANVTNSTNPTISFTNTIANNSANNTGIVHVQTNTTHADNGSAVLDWNGNLYGWWRMNETTGTTIKDDSGKGNNGTWYGNASVNSSPGLFGNGMSFDGVNDYIEINDTGSYHNVTGASYSVSLIGVVFNNVNGSAQYLITKRHKISPFYSLSVYVSTDKKLWFGIYNDSGGQKLISSNGAMDNATMYNITAELNNSILNMYVNGTKQTSTATLLGSPLQANDSLYIARSGNVYANFSVDEVIVQNRAVSLKDINSAIDVTRYPLNVDVSAEDDGIFTYKVYVQNSTGLTNSTETRYVTINNIPCTTTVSIRNGQIYGSGGNVTNSCINGSINNPLIFRSNGTNEWITNYTMLMDNSTNFSMFGEKLKLANSSFLLPYGKMHWKDGNVTSWNLSTNTCDPYKYNRLRSSVYIFGTGTESEVYNMSFDCLGYNVFPYYGVVYAGYARNWNNTAYQVNWTKNTFNENFFGVEFISIHNLRFQNNTIRNSKGYGFVLSSVTNPSYKVNVSNNNITSTTSAPVYSSNVNSSGVVSTLNSLYSQKTQVYRLLNSSNGTFNQNSIQTGACEFANASYLLGSSVNNSFSDSIYCITPQISFSVANTSTMRGANWGSLPYRGTYGLNQAKLESIKNTWHMNILRLPFNREDYLLNRTNCYWDQASTITYTGYIKDIIRLANELGITVILDQHWETNHDDAHSGYETADCPNPATELTQTPVPDHDATIALWGEIAQDPLIQNNPLVWLDIWNEPYEGSGLTFANWKSVAVDSTDEIRKYANNIILIGGIDYSSDISVWRGTNYINESGIIYDSHVYGYPPKNNATAWNIDGYIGGVLYDGRPVFIGESGGDYDAYPYQKDWFENYTYPWINGIGRNPSSGTIPLGYTMWTHAGGTPALDTAEGNLIPSVYGQFIINQLATETTTTQGYIPPIPTGLTSIEGNFWVRWGWSAGTGNITDSYNVSYNGLWTNGTTAIFKNQTLTAHAWGNITVCSYNNTGITGTCASGQEQINNNPIAIGNIADSYSINYGQTLSIYAIYTDADADTGIFERNFSQGSFNPGTGILSWNTVVGDIGTYYFQINVSDGYGSISSKDFVVDVLNVTNLVNFTFSNESVSESQIYQNTQSNRISVDVNDSDGYITAVEVGILLSGVETNYSMTGGNDTWIFDFISSVTGTFTVNNFYATDNEGGTNSSPSSLIFTVVPVQGGSAPEGGGSPPGQGNTSTPTPTATPRVSAANAKMPSEEVPTGQVILRGVVIAGIILVGLGTRKGSHQTKDDYFVIFILILLVGVGIFHVNLTDILSQVKDEISKLINLAFVFEPPIS